MIVNPEPDSNIACMVADDLGGHLSLHKDGPEGIAGLVVSDAETRPMTAGILLDAADRRALAAALLEGL